MTTPVPQTGAQSQALKDAGVINLPAVGSSSGSVYGLDNAVAATNVTLGGVAALLNLPATATADQVMKAFAQAKDPRVIAKIQAYMQAGRMYGPKANIDTGVVGADDIAAFKSVVTTVAQNGADLGDFLTRTAQYGAYTGVAASLSGKQTTIKQGDPLALGAIIEREFQAMTGRKATPAEKAGFIVAYNAAYKTLQENTIAAENTTVTAGDPNYSTAPPAPVTGLPDAATGARFSDHLSSDGPAIAAAEDAGNLSQIPTLNSTSTPTEQDSFDPSAFADEYVRRHAGGETGAHDVATQFSNFLSILGGIK